MMICWRLSFDMLVSFKMCKNDWCCTQNDITILLKPGIEICYGYYSCFYTLIKVMLNNFSRFVDSDILIMNNKTCERLEIHSAYKKGPDWHKKSATGVYTVCYLQKEPRNKSINKCELIFLADWLRGEWKSIPLFCNRT